VIFAEDMKNVAINEEESKKNPKMPYCFDVESKDRTWMVSSPSLPLSLSRSPQIAKAVDWTMKISESWRLSLILFFSFFHFFFFYSSCSFFVKFTADTKGEMEDWIAFIRSVWDDVEQPSLEVQTISFCFLPPLR